MEGLIDGKSDDESGERPAHRAPTALGRVESCCCQVTLLPSCAATRWRCC